jgi:hypothetical protein
MLPGPEGYTGYRSPGKRRLCFSLRHLSERKEAKPGIMERWKNGIMVNKRKRGISLGSFFKPNIPLFQYSMIPIWFAL